MKSALRLLATLLGFSASMWAAGLTFTVSPNQEFGPPGGNSDPTCQNGSLACLIFSSIITPDDTDDYNFTAVNVVFNTTPSTGLSLNTNFFDVFGPAFLSAGDPTDPSNWFIGPTFEIDVDPSTALGVYNATATLIGGTDPDPSKDTLDLGSSPFQIVIVPEPSLGWAAALLFAALAFARRRYTATQLAAIPPARRV